MIVMECSSNNLTMNDEMKIENLITSNGSSDFLSAVKNEDFLLNDTKTDMKVEETNSNITTDIISDNLDLVQEDSKDCDFSDSKNSSLKYSCDFCEKRFKHKKSVPRHKKLCYSKNNKTLFPCEFCNKTFYDQETLSIHLRQHKRKLRSTTIAEKNESLNTKLINEKISTIYAKRVTEVVYSSDSDCEYEIIQTIRKIDSNKVDSFHVCYVCHKSFTKVNSYNQHMKKHSAIESESDKNNSSDDDRGLEDSFECTDIRDVSENESKKEPSEKYPCEHCDKSFSRVASLANHVKTHNNPKLAHACDFCNELFRYMSNLSKHLFDQHHFCNICNKTCDENITYRQHSEIHKSDEYLCTHCSQKFTSKIKLQQHMKKHSSKTIYKFSCNVCGKILQSPKSYKAHMAAHAGLRAHLCTICGKGFSYSSQLSMHMRNHLGYKPHLCSFCGKAFTVRRYLIVHQRIHTQERPFVCEVCNKGFKEKPNLIEHIRTHTGEKPNKCKHCGKGFAHLTGLRQHLQIHDGIKKFTCNVCGKGFIQGGHYREHMRTHSGEKPYVCPKCGKGFGNSSTLAVHSRIHSGDRPYKCNTCGKSFIKNYGLKQHIRTHKPCNVGQQS